MYFLEAAGARGTRGCGGRGGESSLGMKVRCCPLRGGHGQTPEAGEEGGGRLSVLFSFAFIAQLF